MTEAERVDGENLVDSFTRDDDDHVGAAKRLRPLPNEERAASNLDIALIQTVVASENIPPAASANAETNLSKRARSEMSQVGPSAVSGNIPSAAPSNAAADLQAAKSYIPLCLGVTEDQLRAMAATMDSAKRACPPSTPGSLPDPRAWSASSGNADSCSIFTIRAFFGDPDIQLPSRIKALKKSDIQSMMQRSGFTDISGGKDALLHRFQTGIPFVEYRIDGRECLQRVLVVCLDSWGYDDSHLFRASMPFRGDCPWGTKRLRDLDSLCELNFAHFLDALSNERERENWINRKLKNQRYLGSEVDRPTLEALLDRRVGLDDAAPYRTLDGTGFEPGRVGKGYARDFSNDVGGALSLNDCALAAGDRISMCYDFGDSNTIVLKIVKVDKNQQLLPEATMLHRHTTRACVDQRGGARVKSQYASQYGSVSTFQPCISTTFQGVGSAQSTTMKMTNELDDD